MLAHHVFFLCQRSDSAISLYKDAPRPIRRQACSVAVLMAKEKLGMPPWQKMLAMLCSSGTEGDQRRKRVRRWAHSILPQKCGFFTHAASYSFLVFRVSKSSRICCSAVDMSSNFLLGLSLCSTRNAPWFIRSFAFILLSRRCLCHSF